MASLAALRAVDEKLRQSSQVKLITFGQPRVGDFYLSRHINDVIPYRYPNGMTDGAKYQECLGTPQDEDFKCSDQYRFNARDYKLYVKQHRYYFGLKASFYAFFAAMQCKNAY
ncbi:unnamed protein product [Gongylonema pulchrum]|uniref:Lipase_3 domain-containing protein n=1 Tax=Gongylonema pulchrum TaxID=637853 RepID=A0A183DV77_9BILA|nr:unnamed protein product [Gongylonema pulchrum]